MKRILLLLMIISLSCASVFAQRQITGKVIDVESKQPVGFALVSVKGTAIGTQANNKGEFTISLPAGKNEGVLTVSLLGYDELELSFTPSMSILNVELVKSSVAIGDVVVTGLLTFKKETFTGSTTKISLDDMNLGGVTDVSRMLEGKVAGVSIQNVSSTFGSAPKVRIRGATSIRGENKPLWVVDGIVLEDVVSISNDQLSSGDPTTLLGSSVAGINATDIETFDILKDAAATALYGARAMNGVIVITTKRGKEGPAKVTYTGNFTVRTKPRYENFDIMNSADQMSVFSELHNKGLFGVGMLNNSNYGAYGLMYKYLSVPNPETGERIQNTAEGRAAFLYPYAKANTDWFDLLYTNKLLQEHTLAVTFGSQKSNSYASIGFLDDAGATIADKVNRYTANFRSDTKLSDKISIGVQVVGSLRTQRVPGSFSRDLDVVRGDYSRDFDINPFSYASFAARSFRPYNANGDLEFVQKNYAPFNILHELKNNTIDLNVADIKAQAEFNYTIIKDLKFGFLGAVRYVNSTQDHKIRPTSNVAEAYRAAGNSTVRESNPFLWRDVTDPTVIEGIVVLPQGGFIINKTNELLNYNFRTSLSYSKEWHGQNLHEFNAFGGIEVKSTDRKVTEMSIIGELFDGSKAITDGNYGKMLEQRQAPPGQFVNTYDRFAAFYVNVDYSFNRRYSVMATGRIDGSNSLGSSRSARWLPTWTVSAKWNIMNEAFMENLSSVDMMSLRISYGLNATMPNLVNSKAILYASNSYAPGYSQRQIEIDRLADNDLTWEKSYQFNLGYDLSLFRGRLSLYVDYFSRKSFDLIDLVKTSGAGGFMYKYGNYADLDSHGVDITVGGVPIRQKDWNLDLNFTFGYSTNKIKNAKNMPALYELVRGVGGNKNDYAVNSLFSIPFAGLDPSTGYPLFYQPDGSTGFDANMQGLDTDYLKYEGSIDPKYTGGLNATLRWKQLSANIFFSYQWGNVVRLDPIYRSKFSDMDALSNKYKSRWMMSGDELNTNIPSIPDPISEQVHGLKNVYPYTNYNYSDVRVAKGDFIRLKSVSLSYELPAKWLASTKVFKTASVRVTGKDLWLLYSDKALNGQDPEFFNTGGVAMPSMPQVIFTLSVGF